MAEIKDQEEEPYKGPFGRDGNPFPQNDNPKITASGDIVL